MNLIDKLLTNNEDWSRQMLRENPDFFKQLAKQQKPELLWIGCSDSRVPANQIVGLLPGELFVHRNVANQIVHTDMNALSVIEYAIEGLQVRDIIICGHYGCGGVEATITGESPNLVGHWLRHLRDIFERYQEYFDRNDDPALTSSVLCELNVVQQARNVCTSPLVTDAWQRGQEIRVHAWIYNINDGVLTKLGDSVADPSQTEASYQDSVAATLAKLEPDTAI